MSGYELAGFQLANLLLAFIISAIFVFVLYWLWTCPCRENTLGSRGDDPKKYKPLLPGTPVATLYAMELEPGIVVLQSEDGEFFRILREYDTVERTGNGSVAPEMPSCSVENQYIPSYTRAHYQTRPSAAPQAPGFEMSGHTGYDPFGDGGNWRPIHTINPQAKY